MDDNGLGSPQSSSGSSQPSFLPSPVQTSNPLMNRKGIITSFMISLRSGIFEFSKTFGDFGFDALEPLFHQKKSKKKFLGVKK